MSLNTTLKTDLLRALKNSETELVSTLRMIQAAIKNREIELKKRNTGLSDDEIIDVLIKEAKKRKDAIEAYAKGGREDLMKKEEGELRIIERYLPKQLSEEEIQKEAMVVIQKVGARSSKDMGKVMAVLIPQLKGRADGGRLGIVVKNLLKP